VSSFQVSFEGVPEVVTSTRARVAHRVSSTQGSAHRPSTQQKPKEGERYSTTELPWTLKQHKCVYGNGWVNRGAHEGCEWEEYLKCGRTEYLYRYRSVAVVYGAYFSDYPYLTYTGVSLKHTPERRWGHLDQAYVDLDTDLWHTFVRRFTDLKVPEHYRQVWLRREQDETKKDERKF
jgi:hypothetical protein